MCMVPISLLRLLWVRELSGCLMENLPSRRIAHARERISRNLSVKPAGFPVDYPDWWSDRGGGGGGMMAVE